MDFNDETILSNIIRPWHKHLYNMKHSLYPSNMKSGNQDLSVTEQLRSSHSKEPLLPVRVQKRFIKNIPNIVLPDDVSLRILSVTRKGTWWPYFIHLESQFLYVVEVAVVILCMESLTVWILTVSFCKCYLNKNKLSPKMIILMVAYNHKPETTQQREVLMIVWSSKYWLCSSLETDQSSIKSKFSYDPAILMKVFQSCGSSPPYSLQNSFANLITAIFSFSRFNFTKYRFDKSYLIFT